MRRLIRRKVPVPIDQDAPDEFLRFGKRRDAAVLLHAGGPGIVGGQGQLHGTETLQLVHQVLGTGIDIGPGIEGVDEPQLFLGMGHALHRVSLGGSIFWNWFARRHGHGPHWPPGCIMEFRMGDPLLLGRDMYREEALLAGDFRQDIFRLSATVLEVTERDIHPPRHSVHNGRGMPADCPDLGKRLRALVDCGSLHTDVRGLSLARPDWRISDFSGNYAILDMSGSPQVPVPGEHIHFIPSYWAVARTCRMPHIRKTLIHDILPGRSLPDSRPTAPHQGTVSLSEVS